MLGGVFRVGMSPLARSPFLSPVPSTFVVVVIVFFFFIGSGLWIISTKKNVRELVI